METYLTLLEEEARRVVAANMAHSNKDLTERIASLEEKLETVQNDMEGKLETQQNDIEAKLETLQDNMQGLRENAASSASSDDISKLGGDIEELEKQVVRIIGCQTVFLLYSLCLANTVVNSQHHPCSRTSKSRKTIGSKSPRTVKESAATKLSKSSPCEILHQSKGRCQPVLASRDSMD